MGSFIETDAVKALTLGIVIIVLIAIYFANLVVNICLPENVRVAHKKAAVDGVIKTVIMLFGGVAGFLVSLSNSDSNRATALALFSICITASLTAIWTTRKNAAQVQESRNKGLQGRRANRLEEIDSVNRACGYLAAFSILVGIFGILAAVALSRKFGYIWFIAFLCTSFPILASRFSDAASLAIAPYVKDGNHGV
ncbi:hypothetical protein [Xanthomonas hortorum]|uniref:Uncharacterized protein n=1 Tax=Xanthomonas hortorum TaxID=56454 RepID=A0AA47IBN7_9XANT|nr:hypothetical protein [Xanthomonas hortorum]WAH64589.1 hypothetical protein OEG85_00890 [Xanthomonas hortorum]